MKTLIILVVSLLLMISSVYASATDDTILATTSLRDNSIFKLRTNKKFIGATVEIYQSNGALITSQNLERRKMAIDFRDVKYGTYTIRVTKDGQSKVFQYIKK